MVTEGPEKIIYDVVIVGGGIAGLASSIYCRRYNLKTLVIAKDYGSAAEAPIVENYPGFVSISGIDLIMKFYEHAQTVGVEIVMDEVIKIEKKGDLFKIDASETYLGRCVIIATGGKKRELNIPGEKEFRGRGVSYCTTCDAPLYRDKVVAVIGGGDSACVSALHLAEFATKVYQIYRRDKLKCEPINAKKVQENKKIEVIYNAVPIEIFGKDRVEGLKILFMDGKTEILRVDGVFVEIGYIPNSSIAKSLGVLTDDEGYIIVDSGMRTNIEGVFAAGDVSSGSEKFEQIVTAAAEGALAARSAYEYLRKKN